MVDWPRNASVSAEKHNPANGRGRITQIARNPPGVVHVLCSKTGWDRKEGDLCSPNVSHLGSSDCYLPAHGTFQKYCLLSGIIHKCSLLPAIF